MEATRLIPQQKKPAETEIARCAFSERGSDNTTTFKIADQYEYIAINSSATIYLEKIEIDWAELAKNPELPTFSYNGTEVNEAMELYKGDAITVTSKNAATILINGEEKLAENGVVTFTPTESGTYTFVGKNNEGESEEVSLNITVKEKVLGTPVVLLNGEPIEDDEKEVTYPTTFTVSADWASYISIDVEYDDKKDSYEYDGDTFSWTPSPTTGQAFVTVTAKDENAEITDFVFLLTVNPGKLAPVTITDAKGTDISEAEYLVEGTEVTIDCATPGAKLTLTSDPDGLEELEVGLPYTFTLSRDNADHDGYIAYDGVVELENYATESINLLYEVIEDPYETITTNATATFNFADPTTLTDKNGLPLTADSSENYNYTEFSAEDVVSFQATKGYADPVLFGSNGEYTYRIYATKSSSIPTFTISVPEGYSISSISWVRPNAGNTGTISTSTSENDVIEHVQETINGKSCKTAVWQPAATDEAVNSMTFYVLNNNQVRFYSLTVEYIKPVTQLKQPKLTVDGEVVENITELENVSGKTLVFAASKGHLIHYQIYGLPETTALRAPIVAQPDAWTPHTSHELSVEIPDASEIPAEGISIHAKAVNGNEESAKRTVYITSTGGVTTGIEGVSAEAAPNGDAEWFNLQGVRVATPANGIFIRRQGDKVEKVVLN